MVTETSSLLLRVFEKISTTFAKARVDPNSIHVQLCLLRTYACLCSEEDSVLEANWMPLKLIPLVEPIRNQILYHVSPGRLQLERSELEQYLPGLLEHSLAMLEPTRKRVDPLTAKKSIQRWLKGVEYKKDEEALRALDFWKRAVFNVAMRHHDLGITVGVLDVDNPRNEEVDRVVLEAMETAHEWLENHAADSFDGLSTTAILTAFKKRFGASTESPRQPGPVPYTSTGKQRSAGSQKKEKRKATHHLDEFSLLLHRKSEAMEASPWRARWVFLQAVLLLIAFCLLFQYLGLSMEHMPLQML